jgi:hypothetical protein
MKPDEIKLRINNFADDLIGKLFSSDDMFGKLKSAAAKYWLKQNIWKLTPILNNFVDETGDINIKDAVNFFTEELFDENGQFTLNLQTIVNNPQINQFLPNKIILFNRKDFTKMFGLPDEIIIPKSIESNNNNENKTE